MMDVCILLGSRSDLPIANKATKVLDDFGVDYELRVASAHRAPKYLEGIIDAALENDCQVFIGMAGVAAALPGSHSGTSELCGAGTKARKLAGAGPE